MSSSMLRSLPLSLSSLLILVDQRQFYIELHCFSFREEKIRKNLNTTNTRLVICQSPRTYLRALTHVYNGVGSCCTASIPTRLPS